MDKEFVILSAVLVCLVCTIPILIFLNTGQRITTGVVVKTSSTTFPWTQTTVTFVITVPNGTILEQTYDRTYEGIFTLELGKTYKITAYQDAFHRYPRITKIEELVS